MKIVSYPGSGDPGGSPILWAEEKDFAATAEWQPIIWGMTAGADNITAYFIGKSGSVQVRIFLYWNPKVDNDESLLPTDWPTEAFLEKSATVGVAGQDSWFSLKKPAYTRIEVMGAGGIITAGFNAS